MAIDNDTSYELTGAQVKDLAQKIRNKADNNTFVGASSSVAGSKGLVPAPAIGDDTKLLKGDGGWSQATTSMIQDGAVTAAKIDTSTLPGASGTTAYSGTRTGTSWGNVTGVSFTTTSAGLYAIMMHAGAFTATTQAILAMRLKIGSSYYNATDSPTIQNYAGNNTACIDETAIRWIPSSTTVDMQTKLENDSTHSVSASMEVTRIY